MMLCVGLILDPSKHYPVGLKDNHHQSHSDSNDDKCCGSLLQDVGEGKVGGGGDKKIQSDERRVQI